MQDLIKKLKDSGDYRIIEKYKKPDYYHIDDNSPKHIGLYVDVETTGTDYNTDKIIEIGLIAFEYSRDGRIFRIIDEYNAYEDPGTHIPKVITKLTGITEEMVKGHSIDVDKVNAYVKNADIIIAHNASFDRKFIEKRIPNIERKIWGCSCIDVGWREEGIENLKLEYIAYRCGFFYEAHRAINDCLAGVHVLSQKLPESQEYPMSHLLNNSSKKYIKLYAVKAPYEFKDILKSRRYKWLYCKQENTQAWSIEISEDNVEIELEYLRNKIYNSHIHLPFDIIDEYSRFSMFPPELDKEKHKDLIERIKAL